MFPAYKSFSHPPSAATPTAGIRSSHRIAFALLLALVACGLSFYFLLFVLLMARVFSGPLHPADVPGLTASFRHFGLPFSLASAILGFVLGLRRTPKPSVQENR